MKIIYAGPFYFPSSSANSIRVQGVAKALVAAGHDVHIYCIGAKSASETIDDLQITRVPEYSRGFATFLGNGIRGLFLGDATVRALEENDECPDAVILYGTHAGYLIRISRYCRRRRVGLILDVVEWYQPSHLPGGAMGPFAVANEVSMRILARGAHGILAISRYLEIHFRGLGCEVMRVPPLFPGAMQRPRQFREADGKLHLCYVGTAGRKEKLGAIFEALDRTAGDEQRVVMHLVGMTAGDARKLAGWKDAWNRFTKFYGRLSHADAEEVIASSDFMVLVREDKRFSRAGFPSKIAESLSLGTPVISNLTSNLDEYLDSLNSIIVDEPSTDAVRRAVQSAAALTDTQLAQAKEAARRTGKLFSPVQFQSPLSRFISSAVRRLQNTI